MSRTLKRVCNANLLVAFFVVAAYIAYGHFAGLPVDQHFLGSGPAHPARGSSSSIAPWVVCAFVEAALLCGFLYSRWAESNMKAHKTFAGLVGVAGLYLVFVTFASGQLAWPLDSPIAIYVWSSHVVYAVFGGDEA